MMLQDRLEARRRRRVQLVGLMTVLQEEWDEWAREEEEWAPVKPKKVGGLVGGALGVQPAGPVTASPLVGWFCCNACACFTWQGIRLHMFPGKGAPDPELPPPTRTQNVSPPGRTL
jgi:hypothetical protein